MKFHRIFLFQFLAFATALNSSIVDPSEEPPNPEVQVLEGERATIQDYPPIVSLSEWLTQEQLKESGIENPSKVGGYLTFCSGTIIHQKWVLTSAQCLMDKSTGELKPIKNFHIQAGTADLTLENSSKSSHNVYKVEKLIPHPNQNKSFLFENDLGLIKIKASFDTGSIAKLQNATGKLTGPAITFGWGMTTSEEPAHSNTSSLHLQRLSANLCQGDWTESKLEVDLEPKSHNFSAIPEQIICFGDDQPMGASCEGGGGPLVLDSDKTLIGVASFANPRCQASFFQRVSFHSSWINKTIEDNQTPDETDETTTKPDLGAIGGTPASKKDYPPIVSLSYPPAEADTQNATSEGGYVSFCGGTIIHRNWVLTSANCLQDGSTRVTKKPEEFRILVGFTDLTPGKPREPGEDIFEVAEVKVHEKYNRRFINAEDVALVKIKGNFEESRVAKIKKYESYPQDAATAFGWGMKTEEVNNSASNHLMKVTTDLCTDDQWKNNEQVGNSLQEFNFDIIKPVIICFGWKSQVEICVGDGGGPLIHGPEKFLIGVSSFTLRPCQEAGFFTRVNAYIPWIEKQARIKLRIQPDTKWTTTTTKKESSAGAFGPSTFSIAQIVALTLFAVNLH